MDGAGGEGADADDLGSMSEEVGRGAGFEGVEVEEDGEEGSAEATGDLVVGLGAGGRSGARWSGGWWWVAGWWGTCWCDAGWEQQSLGGGDRRARSAAVRPGVVLVGVGVVEVG